jgi:hypothetical protein
MQPGLRWCSGREEGGGRKQRCSHDWGSIGVGRTAGGSEHSQAGQRAAGAGWSLASSSMADRVEAARGSGDTGAEAVIRGK